MPIYEYTCQKCKAHIEIIQKINDKPLTRCRKCGGKLEKQWSQSGFQFKGSGWYITDYARKGSSGGEDKKGAGADTSTGEKAASKETSAAPASTGGD
jgi:putative FmdB family regulatory protein